MYANVYALTQARNDSFDLYMVTATQQEAIDCYRKVTGRPGHITGRTKREGLEVLILDEDHTGAAHVSQYTVGIEEILEE